MAGAHEISVNDGIYREMIAAQSHDQERERLLFEDAKLAADLEKRLTARYPLNHEYHHNVTAARTIYLHAQHERAALQIIIRQRAQRITELREWLEAELGMKID